jgi:hypothetical protein
MTYHLHQIESPFGQKSFVKTYAKHRICKMKHCKTKLSIYNPEDYCAVHKQATYKGTQHLLGNMCEMTEPHKNKIGALMKKWWRKHNGHRQKSV